MNPGTFYKNDVIVAIGGTRGKTKKGQLVLAWGHLALQSPACVQLGGCTLRRKEEMGNPLNHRTRSKVY